MIVFTHNPAFINPIANHCAKQVLVFNLSSLYSGYRSVSELITSLAPLNNTGLPMPEFVQTVEFDIQYANALLSNPILFSKLLSIVSASYEGNTVVVLVERDWYRDAVMESLIKFIQQRYGYNCWIVEDLDDIECIKETTYTTPGLLMLHDDLLKYDQSYNDGDRISVE
jgi:hypothetical protein